MKPQERFLPPPTTFFYSADREFRPAHWRSYHYDEGEKREPRKMPELDQLVYVVKAANESYKRYFVPEARFFPQAARNKIAGICYIFKIGFWR